MADSAWITLDGNTGMAMPVDDDEVNDDMSVDDGFAVFAVLARLQAGVAVNEEMCMLEAKSNETE